MEFEIKNIISFTLVFPQMKYTGISLIGYVPDLYKEN